MAKRKAVEAAHKEVKSMVEDAVDFISSEFEETWARAEKYYAGGTNLQDVEGRSRVVKTVVRDSIRAVKPSVMRTLLHSRKIVEYIPQKPQYGAWAEVQAEYATQTFWKSDGYRQLLSAFDTAAKLKIGPMKVYWVEDPIPEYFEERYVGADRLQALMASDEVTLDDIEYEEDMDEGEFFHVKGYQWRTYGRCVIEAVPNYEFFIDRNASSVQDAVEKYVHGQRRVVTVAEAMELGLEYDDWQSLDVVDPEQSEHEGSSYFRRRYSKNSDENEADPLNHEFLLTCAYRRFDLKDLGYPQLYKFWLGGSGYHLIDYEEVEFSEFEVMQIDPIPFTVMANSIADMTMEEQDLNTSIVRAIADNFHMSNNPRIAGDPKRITFSDITNPAIGAPIRLRGETAIQTVVVPFTGQAGLPLLDYLDRDVEEKVGYTKAATGLDPDAMQSTDKQAVMNTIQLSQGQIELIVRNVIETCLIPLFKKMLRLQVSFGDPVQSIKSKGKYIPVPMDVIDPELIAVPNCGLGTGSPQEKAATLQFILQKQEALIAQYGFNNPFTTLHQVYNTIEDLVELSGITDVSRYFNMVTPEAEKEFAAAQAKAAEEAAKNAPPDPSVILQQIEAEKRQVEVQKEIVSHREKQLQLQLQALTEAERIDLERDKLVQDRVIKLAELTAKGADAQIKREQLENNQQKMVIANAGTAPKK